MNNVFKFAQTKLKADGLYHSSIDGILAKGTRNAVDVYKDWSSHWNTERRVIGYVQTIISNSGINIGPIDGRWGPKTQAGYDKLISGDKSFEIEPIPVSGNWPHEDTNSLIEYFGNVGTNQTIMTLPYPMVLAWDKSKTITKMSCNRKVSSSFEQIFKNTLDFYGMAEIKNLGLDKFGGCLNIRKIRGGNRWSTHSWAVAVDLDPDNNRLRWNKSRARFAKPEYDKFWEFVEEVGGYSLGRNHDFDWMHFQFCYR